MATRIFCNNIPMRDLLEATSIAVCEGMKGRTGNHEVSIIADAARAGMKIEIEGAAGCWAHTFDGPGESEPEYIRRAVEQADFSKGTPAPTRS